MSYTCSTQNVARGGCGASDYLRLEHVALIVYLRATIIGQCHVCGAQTLPAREHFLVVVSQLKHLVVLLRCALILSLLARRKWPAIVVVVALERLAPRARAFAVYREKCCSRSIHSCTRMYLSVCLDVYVSMCLDVCVYVCAPHARSLS